MTAFEFQLPTGLTVTGELLRDDSAVPERLSPDILQILLPSGYGIDVGWDPSFDPDGSFQIVVFHGIWDNSVGDPLEARTCYEAASIVTSLAQRFGNQSAGSTSAKLIV